MACLETATFLTLLCIAVIAAQTPPLWINVEDYRVNNPNIPVQNINVDDDLAEEYFIIPAIGRQLSLKQEDIFNDNVGDENGELINSDIDEKQFVKSRNINYKQTHETENFEANDENDKNDESNKYALQMRVNNIVPCDYIASQRISCYSCYTYIACQSNGRGIIKQCSSPYAPYCNEGLCSLLPNAYRAIPTAECNPNYEPEDLEEASGYPNLNLFD